MRSRRRRAMQYLRVSLLPLLLLLLLPLRSVASAHTPLSTDARREGAASWTGRSLQQDNVSFLPVLLAPSMQSRDVAADLYAQADA